MKWLDGWTECMHGEAGGRRRPLWLSVLAAGVAIIVLVTHWPVLSAQAFSFDDKDAITENYLIQDPSWTSVGRLFGEILQPSTVRGYYRPLTQISLMLDWAMGGRPENLRAFHRTSLTLHVANTVLVIVILYQLLGRAWIAAMVGLLFSVHPLTVDCPIRATHAAWRQQ
jgi:hypothetical protein